MASSAWARCLEVCAATLHLHFGENLCPNHLLVLEQVSRAFLDTPVRGSAFFMSLSWLRKAMASRTFQQTILICPKLIPSLWLKKKSLKLPNIYPILPNHLFLRLYIHLSFIYSFLHTCWGTIRGTSVRKEYMWLHRILAAGYPRASWGSKCAVGRNGILQGLRGREGRGTDM